MAAFTVPDGVNELIREHLVCAAEIARRTGASRTAAANWITRHPRLAALVVTGTGHGPAMFWWPQVEPVLAELELLHPPGDGRKLRGRPGVRGDGR